MNAQQQYRYNAGDLYSAPYDVLPSPSPSIAVPVTNAYNIPAKKP